ncbi:MAG: SPOR domain-containing protein [bacterium]
MKPKHAIGITINGNEVRAAFLSLVKGKACIEALESTKLDSPIENAEESEKKSGSLNDLEKAFDINDPALKLDDDNHEESSETVIKNNNVSLVYSLVDRFQHLKTNVAVNTPVLTVKYDLLDAEALPNNKNRKKSFKQKIDLWHDDEDSTRKINYINVADNKVLQIDYEHHPPIIDIIEEVNQFRADNMNLVLMDTNELALVDLVKEIYKFKKDEITAIIYVEQDFSRVIFLKGREVSYITPIIHKGSMSRDVLEVIYSRIIFAQDQHFIPELNKILVAGHSSRLKAKYYFRQKFPNAITGYLNSKKIKSNLRFKDRGLLFSRYSIPIALAWKALQKNVISSKAHNLLPEYIIERQRMPKLAAHGYLLLLLLAVTAFSFSYLLVKKNMQLTNIQRKITLQKTQVENNKALTDRVKTFDSKIIDLEKKIVLVDSVSKGYDETIRFLQALNKSLRETGDIWVTELNKKNKSVHISGFARRRQRIPILANKIGNANLNKVTRAELYDKKVFKFQLEKTLDSNDQAKDLSIFSKLASNIGKAPKRGENSQNGASHIPTNKENPQRNSTFQKEEGLVIVDKAAHSQAEEKASSQNQMAWKNATNGVAGKQAENTRYLFGLQIGDFDSKQHAIDESQRYIQKGYPVVISSRRTGSGNTVAFTLIIGAYESPKEAKKLSNLFNSQLGIENKIVKYKNSKTKT